MAELYQIVPWYLRTRGSILRIPNCGRTVYPACWTANSLLSITHRFGCQRFVPNFAMRAPPLRRTFGIIPTANKTGNSLSLYSLFFAHSTPLPCVADGQTSLTDRCSPDQQQDKLRKQHRASSVCMVRGDVTSNPISFTHIGCAPRWSGIRPNCPAHLPFSVLEKKIKLHSFAG